MRARQPAQIEVRRQAILDAAAKLFSEREYSEVSLNEIARRASFTKSNVYRYFKTREEIYLCLYLDAMGRWSREVIDSLSAMPARSESRLVSAAFVEVTQRHEELLRLMPLLSASLERNSSEEAVLAFKQQLAVVVQRLASALRRMLPDVSEEDLLLLLISLHALIAGLWPMANPNETVERVIARPELSRMRVDFAATLTRVVTAMLDGLRSSSQQV